MDVPFLGQAYQSMSPILSSQTAINIYPELTEGSSDAIGAFYGTPGLEMVYSWSGPVRGMRWAGGYLWAVIGATVLRLDSNYGAISVGLLPNNSGPVSMIHNETQIAIAHDDGWHWVAFNGVAIAPVAGAPPHTSILTYADQYGLYTTDNDGLFGITALGDLSTLDPLDVADAEADPDHLVSIIADHEEIWLLGEDTTQVYANTGAALFPYEKVAGGFIEIGCCAKFSVAKGANSTFWLGRDRTGQGMVFRSNGYSPTRISTHPIENAIRKYGNIADAMGWCYMENGHVFYVLTFPQGNATWVYDVASKGWHQRAWMDSQGLLNRHRGNCFSAFNNDLLVGDWQNGKIYRQSLTLYTDDGAPIYRERAFDIPDSEQKRVRIDKFQLYATLGDGDPSASGAPIKLWLEVSRNAGRRFGYQRIIELGAIGQTTARARWRRLGNGRDIVLRVATTMANRVEWVQAVMDAEVLGV